MEMNDLGIKEITNELIEASNEASNLDNIIQNAFDSIDKHKLGRSATEIDDTVNKDFKSILESFEAGLYGD